jgi:hypothetical protein
MVVPSTFIPKQFVCNPCLPVPFQPHVQPIITIAVGSFKEHSTVSTLWTISYLHTTFRIFTPRYVSSHHVTYLHTTLRIFTPLYVSSHHFTYLHTTLRIFTPRYVSSRHVTYLHTTLRIFTPRYVSSHHVTYLHTTLRKKMFYSWLPFVEWSVLGASQKLSRGCLRFYLQFPRVPSQKEEQCIVSYLNTEMDMIWAERSTAINLHIEWELRQTINRFILIQINHQPDAKIFQFIILIFIYNSTCFGVLPPIIRSSIYCSSELWFYLRIVVIAVPCS